MENGINHLHFIKFRPLTLSLCTQTLEATTLSKETGAGDPPDDHEYLCELAVHIESCHRAKSPPPFLRIFARLNAFRLPMPRPPCDLGEITDFHAIHGILVASSVLPQKNLDRIFSKVLLT
ncbi:hypothetical protein Tco_1268126 [Tanacetum coccineum]